LGTTPHSGAVFRNFCRRRLTLITTRTARGTPMDLDLKAFSLTLAIGLAVAVVVCASVYVVQPARAVSLFRQLHGDKGQPQLLPTVVTAVVLLALGIICEDLSKNALSIRDPVAFGPQLRAILPTESADRCDSMLDHENACLHYDSTSDRLVFLRLGRLGLDIWRTMHELDKNHRATPEETLVVKRLDRLLTGTGCPPDTDSGQVPTNAVCGKFSRELVDVFMQVYYVSKNADYTNPDFFKELESLRVRFDFERSLVFVLLAGIYLVCFVYLAESTRAMYRDIGGWKTGISLALALVLLVAAVDIVMSPISLTKPCHGDSYCVSRLQTARNWLLPAGLLFVCTYRTRRVWKRIDTRLVQLLKSTVGGPRLLSHSREQEAWRALQVIIFFVAILAPTDFAYRSDQVNYLNRVYGYYQSLRGNELFCNADSKINSTKEGCTPKNPDKRPQESAKATH